MRQSLARVIRELDQLSAAALQRFDVAVRPVAVDSTDNHREALVIDCRNRAHRRPARTARRTQHKALGLDSKPYVELIVRGKNFEDGCVGPARLDRERALPRRGRNQTWIDSLVDSRAATEPVEAGCSDHEGVDLTRIEAPQPSVDITVERHDAQIRARGAHEAGASRAVGTHRHVCRKRSDRLVPAARDESVTWISSFRVSRDHQLQVVLQRHILCAVHSDVDLATHEGARDGDHKDALAWFGVDGAYVAFGDDAHDLDFVAGSPQAFGKPLALSQGETRPSSAESDLHSRCSSQATSSDVLAATNPRASAISAPGRASLWRYMSTVFW